MVAVARTDQSEYQKDLIDVINPITQEIIGQIPRTSREAVQETVERARVAQQSWGALPPKKRAQVMQRWLDLMWERQDEGIAVLRRENGKTESSAFLEFAGVDLVGQYYVHNAPKFLKTERRSAVFPLIQHAYVHHKPRGVVGVISPWNYPLLLSIMDVQAALIAGNAVVFKPSEITPFIAEFAVKLMHEAGIPRDIIQIVHGDGKTGEALIDCVDFVHFTGSTAVGRKVAVRCAERFIPCSLELGGKDPAIVLADADLDYTATSLIQGAFENMGQVCLSIERVYVEEAIYDALIERLLHHAKRIVISAGTGKDVTVASMTNARELERTQNHLDDAVKKGARVIYGGNPRPDLGPLFFEPTILVDVDHSMLSMIDETFGPLMPIMKVKDADEAIRLANDTEYGLSATIYSRNLKRAHQLATRLNTGDVGINRPQFAIGTGSLPTGGQKQSGMGRRNGREGLLKYTTSQSILTDNMIGSENGVIIGSPFIVKVFNVLHKIRRHISFI